LARREFHLPESVRGVVSAHSAGARAKGLRMICRLAPSLPEVVVGDAAKLQSVLSHILDNAVKFTERGKVEVGARCSRQGGGLDLELEVRDTGIGMAADKLAEAFESFRQLDAGLARRYNGLGLGLPVVRKLTMLMGGRMWVESRLGGGSVFRVAVPLDLPPESPIAIALS
jgi:two-component system capsular synthesis sensor histidine kinase RcsC